MSKRVESSAAATAVRSVQTCDTQPAASFQQALTSGLRSANTASGVYTVTEATVVLRTTASTVVRVPYDAERERFRQENLRANGLFRSATASTKDSR